MSAVKDNLQFLAELRKALEPSEPFEDPEIPVGLAYIIADSAQSALAHLGQGTKHVESGRPFDMFRSLVTHMLKLEELDEELITDTLLRWSVYLAAGVLEHEKKNAPGPQQELIATVYDAARLYCVTYESRDGLIPDAPAGDREIPVSCSDDHDALDEPSCRMWREAQQLKDPDDKRARQLAVEHLAERFPDKWTHDSLEKFRKELHRALKKSTPEDRETRARQICRGFRQAQLDQLTEQRSQPERQKIGDVRYALIDNVDDETRRELVDDVRRMLRDNPSLTTAELLDRLL